MAEERKVPYDAGDEQHVAKKQGKLKAKGIQLNNDVKEILDLAGGRRFMRHLIGMCGVYHDNFATNALVMSNMNGMRKVGLQLIGLMETAAPDAYIKLLSEQLSEEADNG
jgi:hypothetical protein